MRAIFARVRDAARIPMRVRPLRSEQMTPEMGDVRDECRADRTMGLGAERRPNVLRRAIRACRKRGVVSIPGAYGGLLDKVPFGAAFQKGLTHQGRAEATPLRFASW
jgi:threonine dehydrogenase-like Zn-dependent dehydrogenase